MVHLTETVIIITNNSSYKESIRPLLTQYLNLHIILSNSIQQAFTYIQEYKLKLVIIDERILYHDSDLSKTFLQELISLSLNLNTIIIVDNLNEDIFSRYLKLGFTYIANIDVAQYMIPAILNYFKEFSDKQPLEKQTIYKGLIVTLDLKCIYFKNCKIFIPKQYLDILVFIIRKNGKCNTEDLQKYLEIENKKSISSSYITVYISRLNKMIYNATGLKIIKNRYGVGYYLVI